jgi:hypothetical protein
MSITVTPKLVSAINTYFDALYECNLSKFDEVFHASCSLFDASDDLFTAMPIAEYRQIISLRTSPQSVNQRREDKLISVDFLSPASAVAKVQLRIHDSVFLDHLNFVLINGSFMIVAKIWHDATAEVGEFTE